MKKAIFLVAVAVFLLLIPLSLADDKECRKSCAVDKRADQKVCTETYKSCRETCKDEKNTCTQEKKIEYANCKLSCEDTPDERECKRTCSKTYRDDRKTCSDRICRAECSTTWKDCRAEGKQVGALCLNSCRYPDVTCSVASEIQENINNTNQTNTTNSTEHSITYNVGEIFMQGCEQCSCNRNGEVSCKKTVNCNLNTLAYDEETCVNAGGLYQPVCKGPYFRLRCTRENYCICAGDDNFTCPDNSFCLQDFSLRVNSEVEGWRGLSGELLGDIGICAELPNLTQCGNGICENECRHKGACGEVESSLTCPIDCG